MFFTNIILSCNIYEIIGEEPKAPDDGFFENNYNGHYVNSACGADSGCQNWYSAEDTNYLYQADTCTTPVVSNGQDVRCIIDKTGGQNITRTGGFVGVYESAGTGVKILGNTTAQYYLTNIDPKAQQTLILVFQIDATPPAKRYIFGNGSSGPTNISGLFVDSGRLIGAEWGGGGPTSGATILNVDQKYVVSLVARSSTNLNIYLDGNFEIGGSVGGSFNTANNMGVGVFHYGTTENGADFTMHELVVYNYEMSDNERQKVESFLKSKWGI